MLSRISEYIWGAPPVIEAPFQPHPSWLALNQARREREAVKAGVPQIPLNPLEARDSRGNSPLIRAIADSHHDVMLDLLERGADIEGRGYKGFTPLNVAAFTGNVDAARILLARGARPNVWSTRDAKMTPLMSAIRQGHDALVRLLIAAGADVNASQGTTYTPLILAAGYGQREMVGMLLQAGANPRFVAGDGLTAESIAAHHHAFDIVELLRTDIFSLRAMDFSMQPTQPDFSVQPNNGVVQQALDEEALEEEYDKFFGDLLDPVTLKPIKNPVALTSGQTVDQETAERLAQGATGGKALCPTTRDPVTQSALRAKPNVLIKKMIEDRQKAWAELQAQKQTSAQLEQPEQSSAPAQPLSATGVRAKRMQFFGADVINKMPRTTATSTALVLRR